MKVTVYAYQCPYCDDGYMGDAVGQCLHCTGTGRVTREDAAGWPEEDLVPLPSPPGVRRNACSGCAYRAGSPELEENGARLPLDSPFYCHRGLGKNYRGAYVPAGTMEVDGVELPLGGQICAGWWALKTGGELPSAGWVDDSERP